MNSVDFAGIGMTSQRTRERLIKRLKDQGISNQKVLDVIRLTPRHLFIDCLLYTSPSPRDGLLSRMPSSA